MFLASNKTPGFSASQENKLQNIAVTEIQWVLLSFLSTDDFISKDAEKGFKTSL